MRLSIANRCMGWLIALCMVGAGAGGVFAQGGGIHIEVSLFENLPAGLGVDLKDAKPVESYSEPAFGFPRIPTKYSARALFLDRSNPFVLKATYTRALPAGEYEFRLRVKGSARFSIDGEVVLASKSQKANSSGHDAVPQRCRSEVSNRIR